MVILRENKAITLIALVITIIVLLLLAGITISALTGSNGLLFRAQEANVQTGEKTEEEKVKVAVMGSVGEDGKLSVEKVKQNVTNEVDTLVEIEGDDFPLIAITSKKQYTIEQDGVINSEDIELVAVDPELPDDLTPIYWDKDNNIVKTTKDDEKWFNYSRSRWANAQTQDGSFWVWIPRFEYKFIYDDESDFSKGGKIDVKIIDVSQTTPDDGYIIHPAFTNESSVNYANGGWNDEISGFWVAKFEMSMEENGVHVETSSSDIGDKDISETTKMVSKPDVTSWCNIKVGKAYINSYNYNRTLESHLMKNSEWGAVAYLAYSKYGVNGKDICINTTYITGKSTGKPDGTTADPSYSYNTKEGVKSSTTGNITGVYDMAGGRWDFTASYDSFDTSTRLSENGLDYFVKDADSTQYMMAYKNEAKSYNATTAVAKIGDSIKELRNNESNAYSWSGDKVTVPTYKTPFSIRGGYIQDKTDAGIFCSGYNKGSGSENKSFRTVLIAD